MESAADAFALLAVLIGVLVLLGWLLNVEALRSGGRGLVQMKPNTAFCAALLGAALALVPRARRSRAWRAAVIAAAAVVLLLSFATLAEWAFQLDLVADDLLYHEAGPQLPTSHAGRMAGGTAFDLVLLSGALVALCRGAAGVAQGLAVVALLAPTLALLGYLYGAQALYAAGSVFTIALHTTVALAALSLAVLFRDPHRALMAPLTSETVGGSIARRLIPAVVLVPVLLGWVRLYGQRRGLYDTEFGSALLVEAKIVLLSGMVWLIASSLGRADAQRRRNEEELARMNADLARSNDELEQFAYVASHDLQEPLRAVAGCTQLLARKYEGHLDEQASELIRHSVEGATRMQRQIEDLLTYSRIATRGREIERTSAEEALGKALANLRAAISESGGRVEHGPLPEVRADGTQLTLLFQNLVGNAVKFRAPGRPPAVRVTAEPDPPYVRFTVADDGIGIDPLFFGRIFGVFQRLHTRTEYPGTGIGLAICKRIVERHGGRIWVDSAPGRGSSFHFTLPSGAEK